MTQSKGLPSALGFLAFLGMASHDIPKAHAQEWNTQIEIAQTTPRERYPKTAYDALTTEDVVRVIRQLKSLCPQLNTTCVTARNDDQFQKELEAALTPHIDTLNIEYQKKNPQIPYVSPSQLAQVYRNAKIFNGVINLSKGEKLLFARTSGEESLNMFLNTNDKKNAFFTLITVAHEFGHVLSSIPTPVPTQNPSPEEMQNFIHSRQKLENTADAVMYGILSAAFKNGKYIAQHAQSHWGPMRSRVGILMPLHYSSPQLRTPIRGIMETFNEKGISVNTLKEISAASGTMIRENHTFEIPATPFPDGPFKEGYEAARKIQDLIIIQKIIRDENTRELYIRDKRPEFRRGFERYLGDIQKSFEFLRHVEPESLPDLSTR